MTLVTVFGGTGFLGRRIVERLVQDGATLRIAVRDLDRANTLAKSVGLARAIPIAADIRSPPTIAAAITGSQSVVNAVSAYVERDGVTYAAVHIQGAGDVATACQQQGVARLVHISGIGANPASRSTYIRARGLGELAVEKAFPAATIMRPSVMFAVDGGFLSAFAKMAQSAPIIPLIGTGGRDCSPCTSTMSRRPWRCLCAIPVLAGKRTNSEVWKLTPSGRSSTCFSPTWGIPVVLFRCHSHLLPHLLGFWSSCRVHR
jgi:uncharacterized protein YbjT (DUF2867 family)